MNTLEAANGCGQRLRQAREAAGLSLEQVASQLHMPSQVVKSLEEEQWQRLGAPVFVRGQLRSYARLLNVDLGNALDQSQIGAVVPPTLVSHTHTPRVRRVAESLGRRAMYVVITAVLAVPVWFASRSHFDGTGPSTASLDVVPQTAPQATGPDRQTVAVAPPAAAPAARPEASPYIASMTPSMTRPAPPAVAGRAAIVLDFKGDSWVDIAGPDGRTVEKALIKAGEKRSYQAGELGRVVLGNAAAVEVQQGGSIVDVSPYQRANVARFTVSSEGFVTPAAN